MLNSLGSVNGCEDGCAFKYEVNHRTSPKDEMSDISIMIDMK